INNRFSNNYVPSIHICINLIRNLIHILFLLLSMVNVSELMAQEKTVVAVDSIKVKKGSYFLIDDQIIHIKRDTVFVFVDSLKYSVGKTDDEKFYKDLKRTASKRKWSKQLYDFLIIEPGEGANTADRNNLFITSQRINRYQGKTIKGFTFKQLDLFGPSIDD